MKAGQGFGNFGDLSPPQGSNGTRITPSRSSTLRIVRKKRNLGHSTQENNKNNFFFIDFLKLQREVYYIDLKFSPSLYKFPCGTKLFQPLD